MAKNYRIRIEALDGAESVIPEQWEKTTCEGFALLTFDGKRWEWIVQGVSRPELAEGIVKSDPVMEAAIIANGIRESAQYHEWRSADAMKKLFSIALDKNGKPKDR